MIKAIKTILLTLIFIGTTACANATSIDNIIQKSEINKSATIAVSVKDTKTNKVIYQYNENKLLNPASVQKIFTMKASLDELGYEYIYKTIFYIDNENNLYIKLSGDPTLTSDKLQNIFANIKEKNINEINDIIIDSSIMDNSEWGIGWMWDDDTNKLLPKYSPYSINQNKIKISITPGKNGQFPNITNNSGYDIRIINLLKNGDKNAIEFTRQPWQTPETIYLKGTIKTQTNIDLTINSPQKYFTSEIKKSISKSKIKFNGIIKNVPFDNEQLRTLATIESKPLSDIVSETLKYSNNFNSEMIFKTAGGKYSHSIGSTEKAVEMFEKYYSDIKHDKHIIVDGCGISRNNLISADWITNALNKIAQQQDFFDFVTFLPKPIEGTLSNRLMNISLKVRAKTGTASNISSIAGYVDTKSNRRYSFAILIQNHNNKTQEVKQFEDKIINEIYKM